MHVIANDVAQSGVFAAEPLVDGETLSVVVADDLDNLVMFHPSTKHQTLDNSFFGHERAAKVFLRCVADFHLGAAPSTFIGVPLNQAGDHRNDAPTREGAFFGALDGSAGAMIPVDEQVFRRLYSLQVRRTRSAARPACPAPASVCESRTSRK